MLGTFSMIMPIDQLTIFLSDIQGKNEGVSVLVTKRQAKRTKSEKELGFCQSYHFNF
jgi:hypothetical protein